MLVLLMTVAVNSHPSPTQHSPTGLASVYRLFSVRYELNISDVDSLVTYATVDRSLIICY